MKAVKINLNSRRDGHLIDRLYLLFKKHGKIIENYRMIKPEVYFVKFYRKPPVIIKKFDSLNQLNKQIQLTNYLRGHDFPTYSFFEMFEMKEDQTEIFAAIEYIEPASLKFTYNSMKERKESLFLLKTFHELTNNIKLHTFPKLNLYSKYQSRYSKFKENIPYLMNIAEKNIIHSYMRMAETALNKMKYFEPVCKKEQPVIIHGDVAYHNFLRNRNGQLYIIDFDLAAEAPKAYDYLQYANRIFPIIDWDLNTLFAHPQLKDYKENRWFLSTILFPSDEMREINRLMNVRKLNDLSLLKHKIAAISKRYSGRISLLKQVELKST